MRRYIFPIVTYSILCVIGLSYAAMAFVDEDLSHIALREPVDLYKLFMGLGFFFVCAHILYKYYKLAR